MLRVSRIFFYFGVSRGTLGKETGFKVSLAEYINRELHFQQHSAFDSQTDGRSSAMVAKVGIHRRVVD